MAVPDFSRRAILRGATFAGAATLGGAAGVGAHSLLADSELFEANSLASGSLDLQLATRTRFDGHESFKPEQDGEFPSTFEEEPTLAVGFPNVDPENGPTSGTTTVALRACDNPARVWLRTVGEQPDSDDEHSDLADALHVVVSYAADCEAEGETLYEGSLSGFVDEFSDGVRLSARCTELGKVEFDEGAEKFTVEDSDDSLSASDVPGTLTVGGVDVDIVEVHEKDGGSEIIGVDVASEDVSFCRADVKGGGQQNNPGNGSGGGSSGNGADPSDGLETYWLDCGSEATELLAGDTPSGNQSGLSHFTLYTCGGETCLTCEDPACLTVDWELKHAKHVAGESLDFDLELFANQCRHTESTNPWQ